MRTAILSIAAVFGLTACGSPIEDIARIVIENRGAEEVTPQTPRVNRAAIEAADLAAVVITGERYSIAAVAAAIQKREELIVYNSNDNRSVTLHGGLLYTTLGFGANLQSVVTATDDPLVTKQRPDDWPSSLSRTLNLSGTGPTFQALRYNCRVEKGETTEIDVIGVMRLTTAITEICETDDGSNFTNQHFIDPRDGEMWRSLQWTGPQQGYVLVDVIDAFTG